MSQLRKQSNLTTNNNFHLIKISISANHFDFNQNQYFNRIRYIQNLIIYIINHSLWLFSWDYWIRDDSCISKKIIKFFLIQYMSYLGRNQQTLTLWGTRVQTAGNRRRGHKRSPITLIKGSVAHNKPIASHSVNNYWQITVIWE